MTYGRSPLEGFDPRFQTPERQVAMQPGLLELYDWARAVHTGITGRIGEPVQSDLDRPIALEDLPSLPEDASNEPSFVVYKDGTTRYLEHKDLLEGRSVAALDVRHDLTTASGEAAHNDDVVVMRSGLYQYDEAGQLKYVAEYTVRYGASGLRLEEYAYSPKGARATVIDQPQMIKQVRQTTGRWFEPDGPTTATDSPKEDASLAALEELMQAAEPEATKASLSNRLGLRRPTWQEWAAIGTVAAVAAVGAKVVYGFVTDDGFRQLDPKIVAAANQDIRTDILNAVDVMADNQDDERLTATVDTPNQLRLEGVAENGQPIKLSLTVAPASEQIGVTIDTGREGFLGEHTRFAGRLIAGASLKGYEAEEDGSMNLSSVRYIVQNGQLRLVEEAAGDATITMRDDQQVRAGFKSAFNDKFIVVTGEPEQTYLRTDVDTGVDAAIASAKKELKD